jgi:serine/threonine protein kinase/tetratricopeptide (TPR) repeat protein
MQVERALDVLLDRPAAELTMLLPSVCEGDGDLEADVRSLLERISQIDDFLESPPVLPSEADAIETPEETAELEGRRLGAYEVIREIARGGMGWVYLAEDTRLDRRVALKVLPPAMARDPSRLARFEREARIVAALNHPGIVTIYSVEKVDDIHFLTMEFIDGEPLDRAVQGVRLPFGRFVAIALPLAEAVSAAHGRGITHRDLKPANVMLTSEGIPKVLDFGVAKLQEGARREGAGPAAPLAPASATGAGVIPGTIPYMSPEQCMGEAADERSDIFSLGVIFHELLTGTRPFGGDGIAAVVGAILREEPVPVSTLRDDLPASIDRLLRKCLEKDPERRWGSAREVVHELERLRDEEAFAAGAPPALSIAVLPFRDMSPGGDQGYFCEGMAEELINALGRIGGLRVASRTSSFQFQGATGDIREFGRRLGVGTVLEGSVRRADERIRVSAQLIDATDGYRIWSARYDREAEDIFAIQDEIAESIVDALELTLEPLERRALRQVATRNVEAYEYYLRGRSFFYRLSRTGFRFARQLYERAIELDPGYSLAYVGLADCYSFLSQYSEDGIPNLDRADEASRRALELDPTLAEAHASRGFVLALRGRPDEARERFDAAVTLNPRLYEAYYLHARARHAQGDYEEAVRLYERAAEVRPEDYEAPRLLLKSLVGSGAPPARLRRAARRALRRVEDRLALNPDDSRAYSLGATCQLLAGDRARAFEWMQRAEELEPDESIILYNKACLLALAGEGEEAIAVLRQAVDLGFIHRDWVARDSDFAALRERPPFRALLESMASPS